MSIVDGPGFQALVERRIEQAIAKGEFDDLPGAGRPLALDDDALIPDELRVAYRLLKNAGYVPPELQAVDHVNRLLGELARDGLGEPERAQATRRLRALLIQLELSGRSATAAAAWQQYSASLSRRFESAPAKTGD